LIWEPDGIGGVISPAERGLVFARLEAQAERAQTVLVTLKDTVQKIAMALVDEGYLSGQQAKNILNGVSARQNMKTANNLSMPPDAPGKLPFDQARSVGSIHHPS
jgi:hypothetical protein